MAATVIDMNNAQSNNNQIASNARIAREDFMDNFKETCSCLAGGIVKTAAIQLAVVGTVFTAVCVWNQLTVNKL